MNYNLVFKFALIFFILISKEFIVFNEEVLVLLAFLVFIFLVIKFVKNSINDSLNEKLEIIRKEFEFYKNLQKQTISYLINYHLKQISLVKNMKTILNLGNMELNYTKDYFSLFWFNKVKVNFEEKTKKLTSFEFQKNLFIQSFYVSNLVNALIIEYSLLNQFITTVKLNSHTKKLKKSIITKSLNVFNNL
uniref:ATP synthase F0 subunit 4 n=1 Tax=Storeatula sp. CCMP1868 TaxID=195070 RepID=A0A2P1G892_9CRYP|nr:ATP synthase F0 subunit 4 [Storeatula sp. CCMP1868]AVM81172.1 ATP synthase F0 subunit 4 [Storeatula sp. CCMP1868]